jgi:hypothetical protein
MLEQIEYQCWKNWVAQFGRCQASTKEGQQCKNVCAGMGFDICNEDDFYEIEFILGVTDRCCVHRHPELVKLLQAALAKETRPAP